MAHDPCAFSPVEYWPTAYRARTPHSANLTWVRGCVVGQRRVRSSPRRRPRLYRTGTATSQRHGFRQRATDAFETRGTRPTRISQRGVIRRPPPEHAPRSADLAWLCCGCQRRARSSQRRWAGLDRTNIAMGRRHELRIAVITAFKTCGERPARVLGREVSADRPWSTCAAQCALGVVS